MSIAGATVAQLQAGLESGELTSAGITQSLLERITACDDAIGAFLDADSALRQAEDVDRRRSAGEPLGRLAGIPVAVKDVLSTQDMPTTCGSRMLENYVPPYDAHATSLLKTADAVIIGKTNMDEFAMGSSNENSAFKPARNPWDVSRTPGGSSGGSAAAVAAGFAPLAIGSDTGGSIRQPAGFCGIVGMKPTYGRISRYGLIAYASSLDQLGPMAVDVAGAALLLEAIAGHDVRDSTSVDTPVPAYTQSLEDPIDGFRIGVCESHFAEGLDPQVAAAVRAAIEVYEGLGAQIVPVELPHARHSVATYYLVAPAEASSNLARYDGVHYGHRAEQFDNMIDMYSTSRGEAFGAEVKRRIMLGTFALSEGHQDQYYAKALKVRRLIRNDFDAIFEQVDALAGPVSPTPAFQIGELIEDPLAMYLSDIYTLGANLAGVPGISIPAGFTDDGLPIGLQLQAAPFEEEKLLRIARMFERETDWHTKRAEV